ncbi:hypothetical protein K490DRAFT_59309 [Saccharata proteae CBS 121410]|uniref:F-box domain-containing protein n=1 Tax=Saccharata proteae CBS 121410 TaxID=1314787 RepID=A0A9P4LXB8_9PEZI|nr:hypothetical protein K490DRAFT_59309 [Saccharata proteae CBS 121410]
MSSLIESLPMEMLEKICFYVSSKEDKSSFRLISKRFEAAGSSIFRELRLWPDLTKTDDRSIYEFPSVHGQIPECDYYEHILADPHLAKSVRSVHVDTWDCNLGDPVNRFNLLTMFCNITRVPNLKRATLRFPLPDREELRMPGYDYDGAMEDRTVLLDNFLEFMNMTNINELAIENFATICDCEDRQGPPEVLERLRSLTIVSELTTLRSESFHLPHLETLALGKHVFRHDDQVEWIIRHRKTLRNLYLDGCSLNYFAKFILDGDDSEDPRDGLILHPSFSLDGQDIGVVSYPKRWHHIFKRFQQKLDNLRNFGFGFIKQRYIFGFGVYPSEVVEDKLKNRIFEERYCSYDDTMISTDAQSVGDPFLGAPGAGEEYHVGFPFPRCDLEDALALNELLVSIGSPSDPKIVEMGRVAKDLETARRLRPYSTKIALMKGPTFRPKE